jgi:outer membrane protein OmpA-like peptidoglycan-associated protein
MHHVYGETAPKRLIWSAGLGGLLMAAAALWLSQDIVLSSTKPVVAVLQMPATAQALPAAKVLDGAAPVVALPASSSNLVRDTRPYCPAALSVYFPSGAAAPLAADMQTGLDAIVDWARQHATSKVAIEGHADGVGVDESNLLLSYQRAKVVVAMVENRGVLIQQVQLAAAGSHGLIAGIPKDDHGNRRVTVQINDPDNCRNANP